MKKRLTFKKMDKYFRKWINMTCDINEVAESKGTKKRTMLEVMLQIKALNEKGIKVDDEELVYLDYFLTNKDRYALNNVLIRRK